MIGRACASPEEVARRVDGDRPLVVIVGSGVAGIALAAALGRAKSVRVAWVLGAPPVPKRLVGGCSLRRSTVAALSDALATDATALWEALGGQAASFSSIAISRADADANGKLVLAKRRLHGHGGRPIGLSTRHGHILATLRAAFPADAEVDVVPAQLPRTGAYDGERLVLDFTAESIELALPAQHLILDTTGARGLFGSPPELAERHVIAVQWPLVRADGAPYEDLALTPSLRGKRLNQLGFLTPFADPENAGATGYGIHTAIATRGDLERHGPQTLVDEVSEGLDRLCEALGLVGVGKEEAQAKALVPVTEARDHRAPMDGSVVDMRLAFSSGAPAINVDGMLCEAVGAVAFAKAFVAAIASGAEIDAAKTAALRASRVALRQPRRLNQVVAWTWFTAPDAYRRLNFTLLPPLFPKMVRDWAQVGWAGA